jgi:hypothetical protein
MINPGVSYETSNYHEGITIHTVYITVLWVMTPCGLAGMFTVPEEQTGLLPCKWRNRLL